MVAPAGEHRPLLGAGLWLASTAALLAGLYGVAGDSYIALALALQYLLIAAAAWSVRDIERQRDLATHGGNADAGEPLPDGATLPVQTRPLHASVQTQAVVLGVVAALVGVVAIVQLLQQSLTASPLEQGGAAFGAVCLAAAFIWLVMARSFASIREADLPEVRPLTFAFREAQWGALFAAAGLIGAAIVPVLALWTGRILLFWIVALCTETLLRLAATIFLPPDPDQPAAAPIHLLLRQALGTAANPISSLVESLEGRCGVSLRSSWAIMFLKRSMLPLVALLALLAWGLTSLAIVETHQMGVRERLGRIDGEPLSPGLHFTLPWPFGRVRAFPVKTVQQLPIGFIEDETPPRKNHPRALLWTKPHAKEELALVLGAGTELVAVNALVYFKIAEDREGFRDYVYRQSQPEEALTAFVYRALMEETRGRTLDEVLSADRAAFAHRLVESVREQSGAAHLGLEVIDLALLNLHPPIEAGGSYLEVISARLDAGRRVTEAEGEKQVALLNAQTSSRSAVAAARAAQSRRVAGALGDVAEFAAIGRAQQDVSQTLRLRLWIEALEDALSDQRLFLVDRTVLDERGELLLDTRRHESVRLPAVDETMPSVSPPAK
jgi:regulator of protease activity HflC (stomatin/prohibitin superfamily)